jgi:hypothetical protein
LKQQSQDFAGKRNPTSPYRKFRRELSKTQLRVPHIWLYHRGIRDADVFLASYPRSGTTWSRFTLFEILTGRTAGFTAVNEVIRPIYGTLGPALLPNGGRLIHTHEKYRKEYKRAIYLVRDVRDVVASEFAYTTALELFQGNFDEFLKKFFCGKISPFNPWQRHVTSWLDSPIGGTSDLLVVRFEELRANPIEGFSRMAAFLGVDVSAERIEQAVRNNSLDKMKQKERNEPRRASIKGEFVRSGLVQGWRGKLNPEQLKFIEKHAGKALLRLEYSLAAESSFESDNGSAPRKKNVMTLADRGNEANGKSSNVATEVKS